MLKRKMDNFRPSSTGATEHAQKKSSLPYYKTSENFLLRKEKQKTKSYERKPTLSHTMVSRLGELS